MGIFRMWLLNTYYSRDKAVQIVSKETNQKVLVEVATKVNRYRTSVGAAAVAKITDQNVLFDIIRQLPHCEYVRAAVEVITDQAILENIARSEVFGGSRLVAAEKLTDSYARKSIQKQQLFFIHRINGNPFMLNLKMQMLPTFVTS